MLRDVDEMPFESSSVLSMINCGGNPVCDGVGDCVGVCSCVDVPVGVSPCVNVADWDGVDTCDMLGPRDVVCEAVLDAEGDEDIVKDAEGEEDLERDGDTEGEPVCDDDRVTEGESVEVTLGVVVSSWEIVAACDCVRDFENVCVGVSEGFFVLDKDAVLDWDCDAVTVRVAVRVVVGAHVCFRARRRMPR